MKGTPYSSSFYSTYAELSFSSALEILPIVKKMVDPKRIVDVGCGAGAWLKAWIDLGVNDVIGIDGSYVELNNLLIPAERFQAMDLSAPTKYEGRFDLVQPLEVAEHLPESSADAFVSFLCSLGNVVLFSAAIPYQGGTNHINEQWPEYWQQIFLRHGFVAVDAVRDLVWDNPKVAYYYAQNCLLFVKTEYVSEFQPHVDIYHPQSKAPLARVHPIKWMAQNERALGLRAIAKMLPRSCFMVASRLFKEMQQGVANLRKQRKASRSS
jgi:hypothetical protein